MNQNQMTRQMVTIAMIAAAYTAIGIVLLPLSFGAVQVRISEALTLLPVFSPLGIWGVTLGCAITNAIGFASGANILGALDIVFGTLATLIAAVMSYRLRDIRFFGLPILSAIPPVILNAVVIGMELTYFLMNEFVLEVFLLQALQVGAGQLLSCFVVGLPMVAALERKGVAGRLFPKQSDQFSL